MYTYAYCTEIYRYMIDIYTDNIHVFVFYNYNATFHVWR